MLIRELHETCIHRLHILSIKAYVFLSQKPRTMATRVWTTPNVAVENFTVNIITTTLTGTVAQPIIPTRVTVQPATLEARHIPPIQDTRLQRHMGRVNVTVDTSSTLQ